MYFILQNANLSPQLHILLLEGIRLHLQLDRILVQLLLLLDIVLVWLYLGHLHLLLLLPLWHLSEQLQEVTGRRLVLKLTR